jgi:DNA recombination protein RmuC
MRGVKFYARLGPIFSGESAIKANRHEGERMSMSWFLIGGAAFLGFLLALIWTRLRSTQGLEPYLVELHQKQAELATRLSEFSETQIRERGELTRNLNDRLDQVSRSVTHNISETSEKTGKSLADLTQRLALIDAAQKDISALSGQVIGLQQILDNKQARGSFGETRLNDLVQDALPRDAFKLQHTLSNGRRADCLILLPNPPGPIVVDSKFPLEAYQAMRNAETDVQRKAALTQLQRDTLKHAQDIAERYILPGETADAALMFLPSESVFSELHVNLPDAIQKCRELRVYPVSPNTMWLTLNTVRAIMRDVEMHQKASLIQREVAVLMEDIDRLGTRVDNLRKHFVQADKDIGEIETSTRKIASRGDRIRNAELDAPNEEGDKLLDFPER